MKLYPIYYTKADLERVPKDERLTFVMACQLANDIQILRKQLYFASNFESEVDAIKHGHIANATLSIRLLAGRLHEGWNFHKTRLGQLLRRYEGELADDVRMSWRDLNRYFAQDNLITRLRQKVGFHADAEVTERGYDLLPADEPLTDYLGVQQGNILYFSAELATTACLVHLTGKRDASGLKEALDHIFDELIHVASKFDAVINGVAEIFISRHLSPAPLEDHMIELTGIPRLNEISIGFFFEPPSNT